MATNVPPIDLSTVPMGANLIPAGATFRVYAPRAQTVCVSGSFNAWPGAAGVAMTQIGGGHWAAFVPGLKETDQFLYYVTGPNLGGGLQPDQVGYKRDPRALELTFNPVFPLSNCVLREPTTFPWHDAGFTPPAFSDLMIYQLHIGTFSVGAGNPNGYFLDVIAKVPYLAALGINAIEPLPVVEMPVYPSMGYDGTDYFSPEDDYGVDGSAAAATLLQYFANVNALLVQRGQPPYASISVLDGAANQLRAMVDLCHVYGIAVLCDVVYGHAGGGFDQQGMAFFDRMPWGNPVNFDNSLYFTSAQVSAGQAFHYADSNVQQLLIDNAKLFYEQYHIDGFRFDQVSDIDANGGWSTCQSMTDTLHYIKSNGILISEYWPVNTAPLLPTSMGGAGFDATWNDRLRDAIRGAIGASAVGADGNVDMNPIVAALNFTPTSERWQCVQYIEDQDILWVGHPNPQPRIPCLADALDHRCWYARSRSRVASGLLLTAPGIPMIFMGQEFLEDKNWSDNAAAGDNIWWDGLEGLNGITADKNMGDFHRFMTDLITLRRVQPALRGEGLYVLPDHNNRVVAFQRWVEGVGRDVMVVATLSESTFWSYQIGFPSPGQWLEVFNSDVYDNWVNPWVAGNGGSIQANGEPMDGLQASATIVIPANGFVVFARDWGD